MNGQIFIPLLGFAAGVLLWSRVVHIVIAVYSAIRKVDLAAQLKSPTDDLLSVFLIVALCSCLGWLLVFGSIAAYRALLTPTSFPWALFFGGVALGPAPAYYFTVRNVRRMREHRVEPTQP